MQLYDRGIAGILIATALHTGRISSGDLKAMAHIDQKKCPDDRGIIIAMADDNSA